MNNIRYKRTKLLVSMAMALFGGIIAIWEGLTAALPGELQELSNLMLLVGLVVFYALVFWLAARAMFWLPEIWMPIQEEFASTSHIGVTRLSRLLAIVVPICVFFFNVANGNFPPSYGSVSGALMAYPSIGGVTWLSVQAVGWVVEGFLRKS